MIALWCEIRWRVPQGPISLQLDFLGASLSRAPRVATRATELRQDAAMRVLASESEPRVGISLIRRSEHAVPPDCQSRAFVISHVIGELPLARSTAEN